MRFSGLERSLEGPHPLGIRLQQQGRGEEQHALNHHVSSFLCLNGGVHPTAGSPTGL